MKSERGGAAASSGHYKPAQTPGADELPSEAYGMEKQQIIDIAREAAELLSAAGGLPLGPAALLAVVEACGYMHAIHRIMYVHIYIYIYIIEREGDYT